MENHKQINQNQKSKSLPWAGWGVGIHEQPKKWHIEVDITIRYSSVPCIEVPPREMVHTTEGFSV